MCGKSMVRRYFDPLITNWIVESLSRFKIKETNVEDESKRRPALVVGRMYQRA
jgi:hypothetical protein